MNELLTDLLACLDLEELPAGERASRTRFRGRCERGRSHGRIFGGQVLAQALMAAGRTAPERPAHSIQALFLRAGDPAREIDFEVEALRDGRSFSARRVLARQGDATLLSLQSSHHVAEAGYEHQAAAPSAPLPEALPAFAELAREREPHFPEFAKAWAGQPRPLEVRFAQLPSTMGAEAGTSPSSTWFRAEADLPDDPLLHQCLLAYASDIGLNDNAYRAHCSAEEPELDAMATVDHTMWFHVPAAADEWIHYYQESPRAARARGFARGAMYLRDGTLVASTGQDSLMRPQRLGRGG